MPEPDARSDRNPNANPRAEPTKGDAETAKPAGTNPDEKGKPAETTQRIGRFEIRSKLGDGNFGIVFRAYDPELHREVAIKVPHRAGLTRSFRERFLREAQASAGIHHPNVCPVYEISTEGELPYIVMHFVAGPTLGDYLQNRAKPLPVRRIATIARKLALGIAAAHAKGVVHRDLKPQNILVDELRNEVVITDFGISRITDGTRLTIEGEVLGTPAYMSPEQARGDVDGTGPASDTYSLGVILYRMLTGELPFRGTLMEVLSQVKIAIPRPPTAIVPDLDPRLSDICMKAMAKLPADRFPSARAMADAIENYLRTPMQNASSERVPVVEAPPKPASPQTIEPLKPADPPVDEILELDDDPPPAPQVNLPMMGLMRCVAKAVLARGNEFVPDAAEALRRFGEQNAINLRSELEAAATSTPEEARAAATAVVNELAGARSNEDRVMLEMYLAQLPRSVKQSLKRPEDPSGSTLPPDFHIGSASEFAGVLPPRLPRLRDGQALLGRPEWKLSRWLGNGGIGEVWLVSHRENANRRAVVKFATDLNGPQRGVLVQDAARAAKVLAALPNPGLVPILDSNLGSNPPWIMFDYVSGGDLSDLILSWHQLPTAGRVRAAVERLRELTEVLAVMHSLLPPLVHRDLKPTNVLRDAITFHLRIADFGVGGAALDAQLESNRRSSRGDGLGSRSLLYASPQQQHGAPPDPRDDVHALGVIAFQMLTGRLTSGVPTDYDRILAKFGVPAGLVKLIGDCAAAEPDHRPRDARMLVERLKRLDEARPPVAKPAQLQTGEVVLGDQDVGRTEVLACPVCKARLQVHEGRQKPVQCPRCACLFSIAAGRAAVAPKPRIEDPLDLPLAEEAPPKPAPRPRRPDAVRRPEVAPPSPRRRRRLVSCGFFLAVLAALGAAGYIYQDEVERWAKTHQPTPLEFTQLREFETGADEARVYQFIPGQPVLFTNAASKTNLGSLWNVSTGQKLCTLQNCAPGSNATLEGKDLQMRYSFGQLVVFNRSDLAVNDRGTSWQYFVELKLANDAGECAPNMHTPLKRPWDVSSDLSRAVGQPGQMKAALWKYASGVTVADLTVPDTKLRGIAFSPDSKWVIGLCDQSWLHKWDAATGNLEGKVRLKARPDWVNDVENADLLFDKEFTRVTVKTDTQASVWALDDGRDIAVSKKLSGSTMLRDKYLLRVETGGKGTFSVFHEEFTLRASKLTIPGGGEIGSWCLTDDRGMLAVASRRKVSLWQIKYP